jgi:hypothetical protein
MIEIVEGENDMMQSLCGICVYGRQKKTQLIILSACHAWVVTRKVHRHTTSFRGIRFSYLD